MKKSEILNLYKFSAVMVCNMCLFFLLINIVLFVYFRIHDHYFPAKKSNKVASKYDNHILKKAYSQLSDETINDLLCETWNSRHFVFEPYTMFKERSYNGRFVNIDENGFRLTKNQGPWPPSPKYFNIFMFGGSTTFGYGLSDHQTLASHLQEFLSNKLKQEVRVYNFGRGFYCSVQEHILFERLLMSGFLPDLAIFVDGLNDFVLYNGEPMFSERFEQFMLQGAQEENGTRLNLTGLDGLPIKRFVKSVRNQINYIFNKNNPDIHEREKGHKKNEGKYGGTDKYNDITVINGIISRYSQNKKIIEAVAKDFGVIPVFVWQPIPVYKYDLRYHLFRESNFTQCNYAKHGYPYMKNLVKEQGAESNFLWLADIQENVKSNLYVDAIHYSDEMSGMLAGAIGMSLLDRNILAGIR